MKLQEVVADMIFLDLITLILVSIDQLAIDHFSISELKYKKLNSFSQLLFLRRYKIKSRYTTIFE